MDAAHDVALEPQIPPPAPGEVLKTAESLREEIQTTSKMLHQHVEELREELKIRFSEYRNPLGLHDWVAARPLVACGAAFFVGVGCGALRLAASSTRLISADTLGLSSGVVRGLGATCGNTIGTLIARRFLMGSKEGPR